jgi:hypothetical protein
MRLTARCFLSLSLAAFLAGPAPAPAAPDPSVAALVAQVDPDRYLAHLEALEGPRNQPADRAAARAYIQAQLESFGYAVTIDAKENVIALRAGSITPAQRWVLGAHHDTVFVSPGADDNASGVAGLLEIARVLAGAELESSVELVSFGLEEVGLQGSDLYAANAALEGRDIRAAISFDMIGFTSANQFVIPPEQPGCFDTSETAASDRTGNWIGSLSNDLAFRDAYLAAAADYVPALRVEWGVVSDGNGLCFPVVPGFGNLLRRSDHVGFWDEGYAAMLLTDTAELRNPNYHTANDTIATLDLGFALNVTRATLAFLAASAGVLASPDVDGDLVANAADNCPFVANAGQSDTGGVGSGSAPNGIGDACECGDVNGDGSVTIVDATIVTRALLVPPTAALARPELCDVGGTPGCSAADAVVIRRALLVPPTAEIAPRCARPVP